MRNTKKLPCRLIAVIILLVIPSFLLNHSRIYAKTHFSGDGDLIPIIEIPNNGESNPPRGPVVNPFSAELIDQTVILECSAYCGDVSVQLFSTAGDSYMTVFHTENGSIDIPISGSPAYYQLILVNSSGQTYMGEFYL